MKGKKMCSVVFLMSHFVIVANCIVKKEKGINDTLDVSYHPCFKAHKQSGKKEICTCNF